ncbi:MAG: hypothetical protein H6679_05495 [Epsilonproteobacteria bacterium]|nr:hypothetical protein [Campylobacterota bacterium]
MHKIVSLLFFLSIFIVDAQAALSGQAYPSLSPRDGAAQLDQLSLSPEERAVLEQLDGVRAVSAQSVVFDKTAFAGRNRFYLGAANASTENSLSRAQLKRENGVWVVDIAAIAPEFTTLNRTDAQNNPLYDAKINALGLTQDKKPLVVTDALSTQLHVVIDGVEEGKPASGTQVLQSAVLKDATPNADTAGIVAATGATGNLFAAVRPNGGTFFGETNSGIALLKVDAAAVTQIDAGTGSNTLGGAYKVKLTPDDAVGEASVARGSAATINTGMVNSFERVSLHWSETLQRLFVGLTDVRGASAVTSLLVGRLFDGNDSNKKMILRAAVNTDGFMDPNTGGNTFDWSGMFDGTANRIIGFNGLANGRASVFHVRTMRTSTRKDYVIVNGGVGTTDDGMNALKKQVYAIAVRSLNNGVDDQTAGIINAVPDLSVAADSKKAKVGVNDSYISHDLAKTDENVVTTITDMKVMGDTVYISVKGTRDSTELQERGIFSSRAIFDVDGNIRAWTPWERAMGSTDAVFGFGVDPMSGNFHYLTSQSGASTGSDINTVKMTRWSVGSDALHGGTENSFTSMYLSNALSFFEMDEGVYSMFNFDHETPAFDDFDNAVKNPAESKMYVGGKGRIAEVIAGVRDTTDPTAVFIPTAAFEGGTKVFIDEGQTVLDKMGPVTALDYVRVAGNRTFYVGGLGALLKSVLMGGARVYTEVQFNGSPITDVRRIIGGGDVDGNTVVYVLTRDKLFKVTDSATPTVVQLLDLTSASVTVKTADESTDAFLLIEDVDVFVDIFPLGRPNAGPTKFALATSKGLLKVDVNDGATDSSGVSLKKIKLTNEAGMTVAGFSLGPVLKLDFVSFKRGGFVTGDGIFADGNLYAYALGLDGKTLSVYRFNAPGDGTLAHFTENYQSLGTATDQFYTIGTFEPATKEVSGILDCFSRGRHFGKLPSHTTEYAALSPCESDFAKLDDANSAINLNLLMSHGLHLGQFVLDTASGAVYIPGEFGVRVRE